MPSEVSSTSVEGRKMDSGYERARDFYRRNYRGACTYLLSDDSERITLEDQGTQRCRFCGHVKPDVSFKLVAHAIPELLGNKKLFSRYECDSCNKFFGSGIEDDFGKWSKPMRTLSGLKGKKGIPTHKGGGEAGWRIERKGNHISINVGEDERSAPFVASEDHHTVDFALTCEPHRPIAVYKTFVKMALSILPEKELPNFRQALAWIMNPVHFDDLPIVAPTTVTFRPGPMSFDGIEIEVICRKDDAPDSVPYAFLLLSYGHESFQVNLPSPERDVTSEGETISLPSFPWGASDDGPLEIFPLDLRDPELVTDAIGGCTFRFETVQITDIGPSVADD
ncbi:HNH endonuclease [Burkholderia cenocepacia]|uniref:HNH endonuclease n=1 Tax=Burkholderia cenocepacia TaxID=95486 RepID=UPI002ABDFA2B|nr:HNH endonuclease [Burkholderia cenocepacia]